MRQVRSLVTGRVPSAHHKHPLALEERTVAGRAVGDALARELRFPGHPQSAVLGSCCKDNSKRSDEPSVSLYQEDPVFLAQGSDSCVFDLCAEVLRLLFDLSGEIEAANRIGKARIVSRVSMRRAWPPEDSSSRTRVRRLPRAPYCAAQRPAPPAPDNQVLIGSHSFLLVCLCAAQADRYWAPLTP